QGGLEASKQRGAVLVGALEAYRADHGAYPERLDDLVPDYLPAVEPPAWGTGQWRYRRYTAAEVAPEGTPVDPDAEFFRLSVAAGTGGYPLLFYDPALRQWVLNN